MAVIFRARPAHRAEPGGTAHVLGELGCRKQLAASAAVLVRHARPFVPVPLDVLPVVSLGSNGLAFVAVAVQYPVLPSVEPRSRQDPIAHAAAFGLDGLGGRFRSVAPPGGRRRRSCCRPFHRVSNVFQRNSCIQMAIPISPPPNPSPASRLPPTTRTACSPTAPGPARASRGPPVVRSPFGKPVRNPGTCFSGRSPWIGRGRRTPRGAAGRIGGTAWPRPRPSRNAGVPRCAACSDAAFDASSPRCTPCIATRGSRTGSCGTGRSVRSACTRCTAVPSCPTCEMRCTSGIGRRARCWIPGRGKTPTLGAAPCTPSIVWRTSAPCRCGRHSSAGRVASEPNRTACSTSSGSGGGWCDRSRSGEGSGRT